MKYSLSSLLFALLAIVSLSTAAPYQRRWSSFGGWGGAERGGFGQEHGSSGWPPSNRWPPSGGYAQSPKPSLTKKSYLHYEARAVSSGTCDLQNAIQYMKLDAVSPALPSPAGLNLFQVALGRGTQNYTCDLANATATPVAVGALATLFNFSCVAAQKPELLNALPNIALNLPLPTSNNTDQTVLDDLTSGHHYFIDSKTPFFNLDTAHAQYGMGAVAKSNASDAPAGAMAGQHGQTGYGAVQWLKLDQTTFAEEDWKAVYRLNTAGGNPPKACTGQPPSFEIQYAAEYWIFN